jgi:hypothetical protein
MWVRDGDLALIMKEEEPMTFPCVRTIRATSPLSLFVITGLVVAFLPAEAAAKRRPKAAKHSPEQAACVANYKSAHASARAAKLREARDFFGKCSGQTCTGLLRQECTNSYVQLDTDIPSVVPVVTDEKGAPRELVEVRMDGELLTSKLDGHGLPVDPGKHEFTFTMDGNVVSTQKVMIVQGQRNRPVAVVLRNGKKAPGDAEGAAPKVAEAVAAPAVAAETPEATEPESATEAAPQAVDTEANDMKPARRARVKSTAGGPSLLTYIVGGVGVVGVAGYFTLNYWGKKDNDKLGDCAAAGNLCPVASVDHVRKLYLYANISGGIGLAALATSAYLYFTSSGSGEEAGTTRTASKRVTKTASIQMVDLQATPSGGAVATIGGTF